MQRPSSAIRLDTDAQVVSFSPFCDFPAEIKLRIWEYCVPDPRTIESVVVMIINLDLSTPKGFIPAPRELSSAYDECSMYHHNGPDRYCEDLMGIGMYFSTRRPVFDLLRTCRDARKVTLDTYTLGINSIIDVENFYFWNGDDDIVYFQCTENRAHMDAMLNYLTIKRLQSLKGFDTIKHVAFRLDTAFLAVIGWLDQGWNYDSDEEEITEKHSVLANFPSLHSISLFMDPSKLHKHWRTGKIALYPPEPAIRLDPTGKNAAQTELEVQERLGLGPSSDVDTVELPVVDIYVMLRRPRRQRRNI